MSTARTQNDLSGIVKITTVVVVLCLGLWGCSRKPAETASSNERLRALERRCVMLEQNYRAVQEARDKGKKELASLEEENERLQKELAARGELIKQRDDLIKQVKAAKAENAELRAVLAQRLNERDELRQQVSARVSERDALQGRCERIRKGLQSLLTQDDTPFGAAPLSAPAAAAPAVGPVIGGQS